MDKKLKKAKKVSNRVDVQVILIVSVYTFFTLFFTSHIYWKYTFEMMMLTLIERVETVTETVESAVDPLSFYNINGKEDMDTELYQSTKQLLFDLKNASHLMYLYTAKINDEGDFVYVVDGLEENLDFRYPNDLIEDEIMAKMRRALDNEHVYPEKFLETEWGYIFIAYLPFHNEAGEVIGVVGLEFDASESYQTYIDLQRISLFIGILVIITSVIVSLWLFRRITNPLYLDKHTKDVFTGMRNRNAYEVDLNNLNARGKFENLGVIVSDINGLKEVNDRLGHSAGDRYIELVAESIHATKPDTMVGYRTGGDEFVIFVEETTAAELERFVEICTSRVKSQKKFTDMRCSLACGYTIYDESQDKSLEDTIKRADELMYQEKRRQKELRVR